MSSVCFSSVATLRRPLQFPPSLSFPKLNKLFSFTNTFPLAKCTHSTTNSSSSVEKRGFDEKSEEEEEKDKESSSVNKTLTKLKRYGISGVLSYGLLNTAYYLTTFLVVWFYAAPAPAKMGYLAAVKRFLKVMAMVWAGSQVTKILRAGGALALAPFVDRGLSWFTIKFGFKSQGKAFTMIVGLCLGLAFLVFLILTLMWA